MFTRRTALAGSLGLVGGLAGCARLRSSTDDGPTDDPYPEYGTVRCGPNGDETVAPAPKSSLDRVRGNWPTTHFDTQLSAANTDGMGSTSCPRTQWRGRVEVQMDAPSDVIEQRLRLPGSPAVASGAVYVRDSENDLYAFDAATGRERWRYEVGRESRSGVTAAGGRLYLGNGPGVLAVDPTGPTTVWDTTPRRNHSREVGTEPFEPTAAPTVADGAVCVGTVGGLLQVFDRDTGNERWSAQFEPGAPETDSGDIKTPTPAVVAPAVDSGTVFAGALSGEVGAFGLDSGRARWRRQLPSRINGLALSDDSLYVTTTRDVHAINRTTGEINWSASALWADGEPLVASGAPALAPAPDGSRLEVYAAVGATPQNQVITAIDAATGERVWRSSFGISQGASPAASSAYVFTSVRGGVLALDRTAGTFEWGVEGYNSTDTCAVVEDTIYVSDIYGHVFAVA